MKPKPSFNRSMPNHIGKKGENNLQKELGGNLTPGSRVGDLQYKDLLVEKKTTAKNSITIKKDQLIKIEQLAFENNRIPALVIEFEVLEKSFYDGQWALIRLDTLKELLDK